eukprot:Pgem_evm1s1897
MLLKKCILSICVHVIVISVVTKLQKSLAHELSEARQELFVSLGFKNNANDILLNSNYKSGIGDLKANFGAIIIDNLHGKTRNHIDNILAITNNSYSYNNSNNTIETGNNQNNITVHAYYNFDYNEFEEYENQQITYSYSTSTTSEIGLINRNKQLEKLRETTIYYQNNFRLPVFSQHTLEYIKALGLIYDMYHYQPYRKHLKKLHDYDKEKLPVL